MALFLRCAIALLLSMTGTIGVAHAYTEPPFDMPGIDREVAGGRVGWTTDEKAAGDAAKADGKPLIVVIAPVNCGWCKRFAQSTLRCPAFNALAGQAHFLVVDMTDPLPVSLGINSYPTTSMITVSQGHGDEVVRMGGYVSQPQLMAHLAKNGLRPVAANTLGDTPTGQRAQHPDDCVRTIDDGDKPSVAGLPNLPGAAPPRPVNTGTGHAWIAVLLIALGAALYGLVIMAMRRRARSR